MKVIIGAVDNYTWNDIKVWALSLHQSGFTGEVVVIVYRAAQDLIDNCIKLGFTVLYAEYDEFGRPIEHHKFGLPTQAHKLRNFHAHQYITEKNYPNDTTIVITDTRDVWFQKNPDVFYFHDDKIYMPSENVLFKDEPWNLGMVRQLFGDTIAHELLNKSTCNSGTFFGKASLMKSFLMNMFLVERDFKTTGSDQPTMNVLGYYMPDAVEILPMNRGWAFQCGTTIDPTKLFPQIQPLQDVYQWTGTSVNRLELDDRLDGNDDYPYIIVHQYDRVPELRSYIESLYA